MHENRTSYPKRKTQLYQQLQELPKKYDVLALVRMEKVRASQLLPLRKKFKGEVEIIIKASGATVNEAQVKALVASLADVNIEEAIKAAPVAVAAAAAPAEAAGGAQAGGEKKEKKEKEAGGKSEDQAMEGLSSLFG